MFTSFHKMLSYSYYLSGNGVNNFLFRLNYMDNIIMKLCEPIINLLCLHNPEVCEKGLIKWLTNAVIWVYKFKRSHSEVCFLAYRQGSSIFYLTVFVLNVEK